MLSIRTVKILVNGLCDVVYLLFPDSIFQKSLPETNLILASLLNSSLTEDFL